MLCVSRHYAKLNVKCECFIRCVTKIYKHENLMFRWTCNTNKRKAYKPSKQLIFHWTYEKHTTFIRKQRKTDKRKATTDAIRKDIDLRDRWLGLRQLKKGFEINPYSLKDKHGNRTMIRRKDKHSNEAKHETFSCN